MISAADFSDIFPSSAESDRDCKYSLPTGLDQDTRLDQGEDDSQRAGDSASLDAWQFSELCCVRVYDLLMEGFLLSIVPMSTVFYAAVTALSATERALTSEDREEQGASG